MGYYIDGRLEIINGNCKKAYDIYRSGVEKGDVNAEFGLAEMYYNGWYVEKDEQRAIDTFNKIYKPIHKKAKSRSADSESQLIIYCLSEWDDDIKHCKDDGYDMLKKATCDLKNPIAQWYMADKDFCFCGSLASTLIVIHYERAAANPNTHRYKLNLAKYYMNGMQGVPQNKDKAFYWCKIAAEDGYADAQLELSDMYANGCGTPIDYNEAVKWCELAEKNGSYLAKRKLCHIIYMQDKKQNRADEESLYNMIKLYDSEYKACLKENELIELENDLHIALLTYAQKYEKSSSLDELQKCAEYYKLLRRIDIQKYKGNPYLNPKIFGNPFSNELGKTYCRIASIKQQEAMYTESIENYLTAVQYYAPVNQPALPKIYYNIGSVYEALDDLSDAIQYYDQAAELSDSVNSAKIYCKNAEMLENIGNIVSSREYYNKAITQYNKAVKERQVRSLLYVGKPDFMYDLAILYYEGKGGVPDYSNALYYFKKCTVEGIEEGHSHYYIGSCFYWGLSVPVDYENAKKHFVQAYEYGFNCNSAISLVESELENGKTINSMRNYAEELKKKKLPDDARYSQIIKDLQIDFGSTWDKTQSDTKKFIATGIDTFMSLYVKGPHTWGDYDFSGAINEMCKALENEMRIYLYFGYITWLQNRGITPKDFIELNELSSQKLKRSVLKRVNSTDYVYEDASKLDEFTLGNAWLTVGKDKGQQYVDNTMLDYLDHIFKENAFSGSSRREEINKYVVSLTDDLWSISKLYRNPAAHSRKMDCKKAEACGDYIIKVKKLLIHFLEKTV